MAVAGVSLLISCAALNPDPKSQLFSRVSWTDGNDIAGVGQGPTMLMSYSKEEFVKNPISSFMYFVPLIAPTLVDNISSVNNDQQVGVLSHVLKADSKSFHVTCEFEILGSGFHMNTFDPAGMIAAQEDDVKKSRTLTNLLDYIKIEGEGYGAVEVKGWIKNAALTVTEVDLKFNAKGHKSPITIGLYDLEPKDGQYRYENRSNTSVVRVNTLAFEKTEKSPRMGIKIASIRDSEASEGFFSGLKAAIANLLIKPPKISQPGQTTMLEFGEALVQKKPAFTFPEAKNIKEKKTVEISPMQK
jgi:hypothetical protein